MLVHMLESTHGISPEIRASMMESGGFAEMQDVLAQIQSGEVVGQPVSIEDELEDPNVPEDAKVALRAWLKRHGS